MKKGLDIIKAIMPHCETVPGASSYFQDNLDGTGTIWFIPEGSLRVLRNTPPLDLGNVRECDDV